MIFFGFLLMVGAGAAVAFVLPLGPAPAAIAVGIGAALAMLLFIQLCRSLYGLLGSAPETAAVHTRAPTADRTRRLTAGIAPTQR